MILLVPCHLTVIAKQTTSEALFSEICAQHGYAVTNIPRSTSQKTADLRIVTPYGEIIAEIKELAPNQEDKAQIQNLKLNGSCEIGGVVGHRARGMIKDAAKQIESHIHENKPAVIVLYDNIHEDGGSLQSPFGHLSMEHIDAAMYGFWTVYLSGAADSNGGERSLRCDKRCHVSAVVVMGYCAPGSLIVYHNFFASRPLSPKAFAGEMSVHLMKENDPHQTRSPCQWTRYQQ